MKTAADVGPHRLRRAAPLSYLETMAGEDEGLLITVNQLRGGRAGREYLDGHRAGVQGSQLFVERETMRVTGTGSSATCFAVMRTGLPYFNCSVTDIRATAAIEKPTALGAAIEPLALTRNVSVIKAKVNELARYIDRVELEYC